MSNTETTRVREETTPASPIVEKSEDAKSSQSELKSELVASIKNLSQKRRIFRKTQLSYVQIKKTYVQYLQPESVEDKSDESQKDPSEVQKKKIQAMHRLLRNFNVALNIQTMSREEDKKALPEKFKAEIESLFAPDRDSLEQLKKALKTDVKEDQLKELPDHLSENTYKGFIDFLEKYEKTEILDKLDSHLEKISKELDEKKEQLNILQPSTDSAKPTQVSSKSKKSKNSSKKSYSDHSEDEDSNATVEVRFRNLLKEIDTKVQAVKLKKNDFEVYIENQHQIDDFFSEAISEITSIKKNLKQRFERIQSTSQKRQGSSRQRSNSQYRRKDAQRN